jgi:hypothetical protein
MIRDPLQSIVGSILATDQLVVTGLDRYFTYIGREVLVEVRFGSYGPVRDDQDQTSKTQGTHGNSPV